MENSLVENKENKQFEISSNNKRFNLDIIFQNNKITLKATSINSLKSEIYENSFSLSQMQSNKYFKITENLKEAFLLLSELVASNLKNNITITVSTNDLNLVIPINNPLVKEISFNLKQREKNTEEKIFELYSLIEKQQLEINSLKNEIKELKDYKTKKEKEKEEIKSLLENSLILNNEKRKAKAIKEWINSKQNIDFKLIFRMTRDGYDCSDFHRCCDNKGETLLLIQTDKNYKIGAYTPLNWVTPSSGEVNDPNDNKTFLFSLNQMVKYSKISGNTRTARSQKEYGPLIGSGTDLGIDKDMRSGFSYSGCFLKNKEITNGESDFKISEIEIFQVLNNS